MTRPHRTPPVTPWGAWRDFPHALEWRKAAYEDHRDPVRIRHRFLPHANRQSIRRHTRGAAHRARTMQRRVHFLSHLSNAGQSSLPHRGLFERLRAMGARGHQPERSRRAARRAGYPRLCFHSGVAERSLPRGRRLLRGAPPICRPVSPGAFLLLRKRRSHRAPWPKRANPGRVPGWNPTPESRRFLLSFHLIAAAAAIEDEQLLALAKPLRGRSIEMINSTAVGGGVAEILNRLVPLAEELELNIKWNVMSGGED